MSSKVAEEANVAMRAGEEAESEAGGRERVQPKGRDIDEKKLIMTLFQEHSHFEQIGTALDARTQQ